MKTNSWTTAGQAKDKSSSPNPLVTVLRRDRHWVWGPKCKPNDRGRTLWQNIRNETVLRTSKLYMYMYLRIRQRHDNRQMKLFIESLDIVTPLKPRRDAFYGGWTEVYTLYQEAYVHEDKDYYDVTSLYHWVIKIRGKYQLVIMKSSQRIMEIRKTMKDSSSVRFFHQNVFSRQFFSQNWMASYCFICAKPAQRLGNGCFARIQMRKEDCGYMGDGWSQEGFENGILTCTNYEVWPFDHIALYDPETKLEGLLTDYANTFLKLQQEANWWPEWCKTDSDIRTQINLCAEKKSVHQDYNKMQNKKKKKNKK